MNSLVSGDTNVWDTVWILKQVIWTDLIFIDIHSNICNITQHFEN